MSLRIICLVAGILLLATACFRGKEHQAFGYIEGRYTYISASEPGILKKLPVIRGDIVKRNHLIALLELQPESDRYRAAQNNLQAAISNRDAIADNLAYAERTWQRNKKLVLKQAASEAVLDNAHTIWLSTQKSLAAANATIASMEAVLAESNWKLGQKTLTAPVDGRIFDTYYQTGEYVAPNQAILSILAPKNIKAIFYLRETDLSDLHTGDTVFVSCDRCKSPYTGIIHFISPTAEYTPPVIYSPDMRTKLVYRAEAAFSDIDANALHPGQPITVTWSKHG